MRRLKSVSRVVLGVLFIVAGLNHFLNPGLYMQIMPPYLPWPLFVVYFSGALEVLFGALVFVLRFTKLAAWGLILLLIAVFPANLHMALNTEMFAAIPSALLWVRLPLQFVLIAWAYWHTQGETTR